MKSKAQVAKDTIEVDGIPCTIATIVGRHGPGAKTATLHAVRGIHNPGDVVKASTRIRPQVGAVRVNWSDQVEDRSNVGREFRQGTANGFRWLCDWSTGCKVYLLTGPDIRHREDVRKAVDEVGKFFSQRLKTTPEIEVIRFDDMRARELERLIDGD